MNLKKKDLIISIVMLLVFIVLGLNVSVLATSTENNVLTLPITQNTTNNNTNNQISQIVISNTSSNTANNLVTNSKTANTNVPNTGLTDLPWVVIGVCVVSAVFAYKKIKEYNVD